MYLSAVGYGMVLGGIYINTTSDDDVPDDLDNGLKLVFAGGLITTLFWVWCVLCFFAIRTINIPKHAASIVTAKGSGSGWCSGGPRPCHLLIVFMSRCVPQRTLGPSSKARANTRSWSIFHHTFWRRKYPGGFPFYIVQMTFRPYITP